MPHCYPVGEGRFKASLNPALGGAKESDRLDNERVFVAMGGSEPVAYIKSAKPLVNNYAVRLGSLAPLS